LTETKLWQDEMPVRLNMLKANTFCKKNVQNERDVRRNH